MSELWAAQMRSRPCGAPRELVEQHFAALVCVHFRKFSSCILNDYAPSLQLGHRGLELLEADPAIVSRIYHVKQAKQLGVALEIDQQQAELRELDKLL